MYIKDGAPVTRKSIAANVNCSLTKVSDTEI